jgi:hypothetical protein
VRYHPPDGQARPQRHPRALHDPSAGNRGWRSHGGIRRSVLASLATFTLAITLGLTLSVVIAFFRTTPTSPWADYARCTDMGLTRGAQTGAIFIRLDCDGIIEWVMHP